MNTFLYERWIINKIYFIHWRVFVPTGLLFIFDMITGFT